MALDPELATLAALIDGVPETVTGGTRRRLRGRRSMAEIDGYGGRTELWPL